MLLWLRWVGARHSTPVFEYHLCQPSLAADVSSLWVVSVDIYWTSYYKHRNALSCKAITKLFYLSFLLLADAFGLCVVLMPCFEGRRKTANDKQVLLLHSSSGRRVAL